MMEKQFYDQVGRSSNVFLIFAILSILFYSGISFTFVIPGLKGFSFFTLIVMLVMYFLVANIFVGLFKEKTWYVLMICFLLSSLGMGWRLWLEWGEYSLVEHMNLTVYMAYPSVISIIVVGFYWISSFVHARKVN